METNETPMTSNVSVPVSSESVESVHFEAQQGSLDFNHAEQTQDEIETSDKILDSAKNEGFEEALTRLANGDFDQENDIENEGEKDEPENQSDQEEEKSLEGLEIDFKNGKDAKQEVEFSKGEEEPLELDDERDEMVARIKDLDSQIVDLEEKNKELFEKVKHLETNNTLAMQTLLEMTMVLHELLKEEEDDEKKMTAMEALIKMMGELMRAMFVPDNDDGIDRVAKMGEGQKETVKNDKKRDVRDVIRKLQEKGMIRSDLELQSETPRPSENASEVTAQAA